MPALALLALYRWSDAQIDENEAAPPPPTTNVAPPPPEPPLSNDVLTFRRLPSIISRDLNVAEFQRELLPFLGTVNSRSCVAVSVDGVPIGSQNADIPVIPASNQKIVVGAVALDVLGEDFRFTTEARAPEPVDGVISGDLYLVGGGDPLLTSEWYPTSNLERYPVTSPTSLEALADSVVAAGVVRIDGGVVGDGSRYDDEYFAPGWGVGVAGLDAGPYDALLVNDARVLGEEQKANDPNAGAAREFTRLLRDRGVVVAQEGTAGVSPTTVVLASVESAPLSEVVGEMLANSDNNTAELVVKEIGFAEVGVGSREAGLGVMLDRVGSWGIDTTGLVFDDGSGLSLNNRITCAALLDILQRSPSDGPIGTGLPIAGVSGTLAEIFVGHPVEGRLSGKTGTLNNPPFNEDPPAVKALAGYVAVDGGGAVEYVLILNGPTISDQSEYRPVWNGLADVLATYPAGASPAELGLRP